MAAKASEFYERAPWIFLDRRCLALGECLQPLQTALALQSDEANELITTEKG